MFTVDQIKAAHSKVKSGIEKWVVCLQKMTCTYYDKAGNEILTEQIPSL